MVKTRTLSNLIQEISEKPAENFKLKLNDSNFLKCIIYFNALVFTTLKSENVLS